MIIDHIKPFRVSESSIDEFQLDASSIAQSINEGPQKRVLAKLKTINQSYVLPRTHYTTRTKSPKFKPLEITENFRWKRGYRDLIIDVINRKFNQYNKSSASLQVLLKNRPERTQWQKDDFITNVIDIDTMMRTLRANKQSFADNENIFEILYNHYFTRHATNWEKFIEYVNDKHPNMDFSYKLLSQTGNDNSDYSDLLFKDTWLQYTLLWKDAQMPVITDTGELLHTIDLGDIIMNWNVRLFPLMQQIINRYYRHNNNMIEADYLDYGAFDQIINSVRVHKIESWEENPFRQRNAQPPYHLNDFDRNRWFLHQEMENQGLLSRATMIKGRNTSLDQNDLFGRTSDSNYACLNTLSHPYINNVDIRMSRQSNETHYQYQDRTLLGSYRVPSDNYAGRYDLNLQTICWGDLHNDMWSSLVKCNFMEWLFHINSWNRYSIPGSNPLNNISKTHYGMPADFPEEYRSRITQSSSDCFKSKLRHHQLTESEIEGRSFSNPSNDRQEIYHGYNQNELSSDEKQHKMMNIISHCDKIKCTLRNHCDWFATYAQRLNDILGTEADPYPFGSDIYGLRRQAEAEAEQIREDLPELSSLPDELPSFGSEEEIEEAMNEIASSDLPWPEAVRDPESPFTDNITGNRYTEDEIQQIESEEQVSDEQQEIIDSMRTWAAARRGR